MRVHSREMSFVVGGENEGQMVYIVGGGRESRGRIDKTLKE